MAGTPSRLLQRAGPHKSHSRVSRAQWETNRVASTRRQAEPLGPKQAHVNMSGRGAWSGVQPPPPPHPTALPSTGPAADSPSPHRREGRAGSFPPGPLGSPGSKRVGPTRPASESRPDPSPLPGGLRALRRPPQSRAWQGPQPRYCSKLRLRQGSVSEAPPSLLSALAPAPTSLPCFTPARESAGSLLGGQVSKCGTGRQGLLLLRGPGPSPSE